MKNIAEILKNAPKGLKLYSPILGEVEFDYANDPSEYPIIVQHRNAMECFDKYGKYFDKYGDCVLFPSSGHQTWKDWQKVLIPKCVGSVIKGDSNYSYCSYLWIVTKTGMFAVNMHEDNDNWFYQFEETTFEGMEFASSKETEAFFERLDKLGYKFENGEVVKKEEKKWSIYDANDGDILQTFDDETLIFARISDNCAECYVSYNSKTKILSIPKIGVFYFDDFNCIMRPATQEEKDELLKKLDEEGYVWNQEELRLELKEKSWSIYDAKDGDLLSMGDFVFLYKSKQSNITANAYIIIEKDGNKIFTDDWCDCDDSVKIASDQEKLWFYKTLSEAGYHWNPLSKHLLKRDAVIEFTINDFKPFDKVLVRSKYGYGKGWECAFYSHYNNYEKGFITIGSDELFDRCVPYNKETAHLLGTTEEYNGKYKTW